VFIAAFAFAALIVASGAIFLASRRRDRGQLSTSSGAPIYLPREHLPVLVLMNPTLSAYDAALTEAVRFWNHEIGRVVIVYGGHAEPEAWARARRSPGVVYIDEETADVHSHARLIVAEDGRILAGPISVRPDVPAERIVRVLVHELGHSPFGLAHDDAPSSPMYPSALPVPFELSEPDRLRLRSLYG
jgi:hypothetical protein